MNIHVHLHLHKTFHLFLSHVHVCSYGIAKGVQGVSEDRKNCTKNISSLEIVNLQLEIEMTSLNLGCKTIS